MADDTLNLNVKVNAETKALDIATKGLEKTGKQADKTKASFSGLSDGTKSLLSSLGMIASVAAIGKFFKDAVSNAEKFNEAVRKVEFNLKSLGLATDKSRDELVKWSAAVQASTRFGDDIALGALNKMLRVTGDLAQSQAGATLAMDLAVASGKDLGMVSEMVSQLMIGETRAVIMMQKEFGAFIGTAESTQSILDSLQETLGGAAAAENSLTKDTAKLSNSWEDFGKMVGFFFNPILQKLIQWLTKALDMTENFGVVFAGIMAKVIVHAEITWRGVLALAKFNFEEIGRLSAEKSQRLYDIALEEQRMFDEVEKAKLMSATESVRLISKVSTSESKKSIATIEKAKDKAVKDDVKREQTANKIITKNAKTGIKDRLKELEILEVALRSQGISEIEISRTVAEAKLNIYLELLQQQLSNTMENLKLLAEEGIVGKNAYKSIAIAETIISTYRGAQDSYSSLAGIPIVGPALGTAAAAVAVAAGMVRVSKIQAMESGGFVPGSPSGVYANVGEKGRDEAVIPLENSTAMGKIGSAIADNFKQPESDETSSSGTTNIYVNVSADKLSIDKNVAVLNALAELIAQKTPGAIRLSRNLSKLQNENKRTAT